MGVIIPNMGTSKESLSETLFSKTQRGVLGLLFGNPERSYYANEIVRHAQAGIGTVQRELDSDPQRQGFAVIIRLDRIMTPAGEVVQERDEREA